MNRRPRGRTLWGSVVVTVLLSAACADYSQLNFRKDDRLTFRSPKDGATVSLPVVLDWDMRDFDTTAAQDRPSRNAGYFAVFVDRAPVRPGRTLSDLADGDDVCSRVAGCPDADYLADRQVYTTSESGLTLREVRPRRGDGDDAVHEVTVVLLDVSGRRIGESAWHLEFKLDPEGGL